LRSIPDKVGGVVCMFGALLILFLLPFLNQSSISSTTFRLVYGILLAVFVLDVAYLG